MELHDQIIKIGKFVTYDSLKEYFNTEGVNPKNFWNQLRTDLMRQTPQTIEDFLTNPESRLNHIEDYLTNSESKLNHKDYAHNFGDQLYKHIFSKLQSEENKRITISAFIHFCLEMSAAYKLQECEPKDKNRKQIIKDILQLQEVK